MNPMFSRITIFCRDVERSLSLYRDTLGFRVLEDKTIEGPAAGALIGLGSCSLRMILLGENDESAPVLGLFQISNAEVPETALPPEGIAHGKAAMVINTDDFDGVYEKLKADKVQFLTEPLSYNKPTSSPYSPAGTYREMIFRDPDNLLVSVMQIIPEN